ncbi:MAG: rod shape-determining protein MreC [Ruminococcaceae bacterium]|nr:rod shape-determining protein MreC [Oscillospiraceae bacterium]
MAYGSGDVVTRRQSRFFALSIIVSVILSLTALVSYFSGFSNILTGIVNVVVYPINSCVDYISDNIRAIGNYFGDIAELKEENMRLKAENNSLLIDKAASEAIKKENEQLYAFLDLKRDFEKLSLVNGKIISKGSGNFLSVFTIDKGTMHGVHKNMPVVAANGLIGYITEEGPVSSRGITLISHSSSVGVYFSPTGATGILHGDYKLSAEGKCKVSGLPADTLVKIGDPVLTSGAGEIYPKDLSVGTVTDIYKDSNTQTLTVVVTPGTDLINEESIMVITDFERVYEKVDGLQE